MQRINYNATTEELKVALRTANPDINGINILEPRYHGEVIERLDSGKTYVLALPTCEPSAVQNEYTGQWLDVMKVRAINICVDKKNVTQRLQKSMATVDCLASTFASSSTTTSLYTTIQHSSILSSLLTTQRHGSSYTQTRQA